MTMSITSRHALLALILGSTLTVGGKAAADQVIPDDLIVQGSLCVGFDCVNNMNFGSDTIVLRENQLRIFFQDTSIGNFPTNDWRFLVNGAETANFFALQDEGTAGSFSQVFRIDSGAPSSAFRMDQSGRIGLGTATPVLKVHLNTSDTPGQRFEQNGNGGFTPQTWDVAGNEANFFVRDVTGGSRLPFRIRPGAPTSSIDIAASGNIGVGTAAPNFKMDVLGNLDIVRVQGSAGNAFYRATTASAAGDWSFGTDDGSGGGNNAFVAFDRKNSAYRFLINNSGNVGIGTTTPAARLHTVGTVRLAGVANCAAGIQSNGNGDLSCLASSRQFKNVAGELPSNVALANIMALRPQTGSYKDTPDIAEHWLIAEEVAAVDPALVGLADGKPHTVKTQNVVADLIAVVQQQQRRIEQLEQRLTAR
jgi:hypothetical protein